ncbi:MAG TPA: mycofactocin system transcriptional regulator [Frankiaceae bacterium]|jgi:mycofactocin system transcriptional regulator|nr:mycofactocin system transcriptional regulator [Frankiaceae bacterium]
MGAESTGQTGGGTGRRGRRAATSRHELEKLAFELFERRGFDATTVDDIAAAAGIGRRTFFRYFESKNDLVWGSFTDHLERMREQFALCSADPPVLDAVRTVVVEFNRFDPQEVPWHRRRMELILGVPTLQGNATLRYTQWRVVVAEFVAARLEVEPDSLTPHVIAHAALGVALAAYAQWLADPGRELTEVIDEAFATLIREGARADAAGRHRVANR